MALKQAALFFATANQVLVIILLNIRKCQRQRACRHGKTSEDVMKGVILAAMVETMLSLPLLSLLMVLNVK